MKESNPENRHKEMKTLFYTFPVARGQCKEGKAARLAATCPSSSRAAMGVQDVSI